LNLGSGIRNQESAIRGGDQGSGIRDQGSGVRVRIRDPKSLGTRHLGEPRSPIPDPRFPIPDS
jgi:hypothetical protein